MMFSDLNMYMWDSTADNVNSPTADLNMQHCKEQDDETARRRKRRATEEEPSAVTLEDELTIELPLKDLEVIQVNTTTSDRYGMLYHRFNISEDEDELRPVSVSVYPLDNDTLILYARLGGPPSPTDHQWNMIVSRNISQTEENIMPPTLYIPTSNLTNNNGSIWVGVGLKGEHILQTGA